MIQIKFATENEYIIVDVVGPINVITVGTLNVLHDEGTGNEYYFTKDGNYDGDGISATHTGELNAEEAKALLQGLKEIHEGKTKPFTQIQEELGGKKRLN